jgi:uncharacterized protein (UPF0248 family)
VDIREILNKINWDPSFSKKKDQFFIQYTHRGALDNNLIICYSQIKKVRSGSFEYWNDTIRETVRIPFHRIEKIFNKETHEILYKKRSSGAQ